MIHVLSLYNVSCIPYSPVSLVMRSSKPLESPPLKMKIMLLMMKIPSDVPLSPKPYILR